MSFEQRSSRVAAADESQLAHNNNLYDGVARGLLSLGICGVAIGATIAFQPEIELATKGNLPFIGCLVPSADLQQRTETALMQTTFVDRNDPRIPRYDTAANYPASSSEVTLWRKQVLAEKYGLTVFDTTEQQAKLWELLFSKKPEALNDAYTIAADTMRRYGIELHVPDLTDAIGKAERTSHDGISDSDSRAFKLAFARVVMAYQDKPKELIELAKVKTISLERNPDKYIGKAFQFEGKISFDPYQDMGTTEAIDTLNHELGHMIDSATCDGFRGTSGDPAFRSLNPTTFRYDGVSKKDEKSLNFLVRKENSVIQFAQLLKDDKLKPSERTKVQVDLDNLKATVMTVKQRGLLDRTEDIGTLSEVELNPPRYGAIRALKDSTIYKKFVFLLSRLDMLDDKIGKNIAAYYMELGGTVIDDELS